MEKCRSDGEVGEHLYVACMLVDTAMQSNPDTRNSSNGHL